MSDLISREAAMDAVTYMPDRWRKVAVDAIRSLPASPAVKVKELDWKVDGERYLVAESCLGLYNIIKNIAVERWVLLVPMRDRTVHETEGSAKAAAQADYEARILAAIEP